VEGGGLFVVEGAAAPHASALAFEGHIAADQFYDIGASQKLVEKMLG
jgi:hypothetical protein